MWQLILKLQHPQLKSPPGEQGFSMVEVLVSILVTTAFIMGTLQAMVINTIFQVRSEREAQATFWIQEDIEKVKGLAELPPLDGSDLMPCILGIGTDAFENGFGGKLRDHLSTNYSENPGGGNEDVQIVEEKFLVNKTYRMVRIIQGTESSYALANESPHLLRITYKVGEPDDSTADKLKADDGSGFKETLAQVYTEVIPSGAFQCSDF